MKKKKKRVSRKRKNQKKLKARRNKLILGIIIIVILIVLVILFINSKKIECSKSVSSGGFKIDSNVILKLSDNKINSIKLKRNINVMENNGNINYISMIKSSIEELYKTSDDKYSIDLGDNDLTLNAEYTNNKKYIIDNIFIEKETEGISFNIIKEDTNGSYATFDLSDNYNKKDVIKILEKASYICK